METKKTITLTYNQEKYRYWVRFSDSDQLHWIYLSQFVEFVEQHKKEGYKIITIQAEN